MNLQTPKPILPNPRRWRVLGFVAVSIAFSLLSACGGKSGGSGATATNTPTTSKKGQFIDSQVSGLEYETERRSGVTDASGTFEYDSDGELITFSIGATVIGTAKANGLVHVFDVSGQNQLTDTNRGERLAQRNRLAPQQSRA